MRAKGLRVRRSALMMALACLPFFGALLIAVAGAPMFISLIFCVIGAIAVRRVWSEKPLARRVAVEIEVTPSELRLDETLARKSLRGAEILGGNFETIVRVGRFARTDVELVVENRDVALDLLRALGFDASHRAIRYVVSGLPFLPVTIVIGVDGIFVRWLWRRTFVPVDAIEHVSEHPAGLLLRLRDGQDFVLPISAFTGDRSQRLMIAARIAEVRDLARTREGGETSPLALERGAQSFGDWIARLKTAASAETPHRSAAVTPEQLWRVASDTAQTPVTRAAAAVALAGSAGEEDRVRLGDLARATAEPKLRVVLERVASDATDEEIEGSLRELESH